MQDGGSYISFGYFSAALLATSAVALASGMQFLIIGWRQRREPTHLSFAALCLCVATLALCSALLNVAGSMSSAIFYLRIIFAAALVALPTLVVFIGHYTERPVNRIAFACVVAASAYFFWLNVQLPYGLLDTRLAIGPRTLLPWGESLFTLEGTTSLWGHAFRCFSYAIFLWAIYRGVRQYFDGQRMHGALLTLCLLVQFVALLWGAIIVNTLGKPFPSLDAFAFLSFVLLMGLSLAGQMHSHAMQLERTTQQLREEAETRREAELDLRHAASHDALTGLPNRLSALHSLAELLTEAGESGQLGAVLMIDLDNFKTINDSLGHYVGDRVLETIADTLLSSTPSASTVARLGGDEFVVLLRELHADADAAALGAMQVAETMLQRLASPVQIDSRVLGIGASIGIAIFPNRDAAAVDVMRCADIALYRAKAAGRNTARLFLPQMQREADDRLALERGLRSALERQEFSLCFQPQISMRGKLVGAEALLRWNSPSLGQVSPAVFIPVAEETGLIHSLGAWVIGEVCRRIHDWQRLGVDFGGRVSVNVSPWQIAQSQFVEQLESQVAGADIDPSWLTLELTESALLVDFDAALKTLHRLAAIGFRLALDDFGTGYSSLAYLQQLPLDELKIDQAFISALDPTIADPLAGFIIDVGSRLGIATIAEGVETWQQKVLLETLGCEILQGYFICRPLPETAFLAWLANHAKTSPPTHHPSVDLVDESEFLASALKLSTPR
jgi:diguanylate cyclase (GGDEF)-like protein